jgi:hypothetical protein
MRSILIAMLLLFSAAANSAAIEWTFQDAVFDDGATLSGSFVMQEGGTRTDVNLSMTGGSLSDTNYSYFFNSIYVSGDGGYLFQRATEVTPQPADLTGQRVLELAIVGDLETAGTISLDPVVDWADVIVGPPPDTYFFHNREVFCGDSGCLKDNVVTTGGRTLVSGSLVGVELAAVPVPAAVWLFGSALAGLGAFRRKRTV